MKLTEDDLSAQTEVRVHLDVWLKRYEWEEILEDQEKAKKLDSYHYEEKIAKLEDENHNHKEKLDAITVLYLQYSNCVMDSITFNTKLKELLDAIHSMEAVQD